LLGSKVCGYVPQGLTTLPCTVANFLVFHFYFFCFCFFPFSLLPSIVLFLCVSFPVSPYCVWPSGQT
jgi:hypothetical protein